jgi:uncharacterized membrane protein
VSPAQRRIARLTVLLGGSGVLHFLAPAPYRKIVPPSFGDPARLVRLSGVAELGCAALLATPQTRRLGGWASAALFVAVFPANLYAVKAVGSRRAAKAVAIARLPLQLPMISSALAVARDG